MSDIYQFEVKNIKGETVSMSDYKGKVLLIVNTASRCGFTPQYQGLQKLYSDYKDQGFEVLGFPCNQFGSQEPGDANQIQEFCSLNFSVNFPLFEKIKVNGKEESPLYTFLKDQAPGILGTKQVKWNFTKFLVDKTGTRISRHAPKTTPEELATEIQKLL